VTFPLIGKRTDVNEIMELVQGPQQVYKRAGVQPGPSLHLACAALPTLLEALDTQHQQDKNLSPPVLITS
jgi:hypothetical protein